MLTEWEKRLHKLMDEKPLEFLSMSDYEPVDPDDLMQGYQLKDEVIQKAKKQDCGLTVGQHLGKAIPKGSMVKR